MFVLPEREHDGFPVSVPAVSRLPAVSELLLARPRQRAPQQPAPDEGALVLGKVPKVAGRPAERLARPLSATANL